MSLIAGVEIIKIKRSVSSEEKPVQYYPRLPSNETIVAIYPPKATEYLYVHCCQTDYWKVVQGDLTCIILRNRQYQYIPLSGKDDFFLKIPPRVPHGAINLHEESAVLVNAIICHKKLDKLDSRRIKPPFPYDLEAALSSSNLSR